MTSSKDKKKEIEEENLDEYLDEISLSSKDPEDFTPQAPGSDFVGPDAYGDEPSDYLGWTSESKNLGKIMKISRKQLRNILNQETSYLFEDCGCGGGHPTISHGDSMQPYGSVSMETMETSDAIGSLSREEALDLVSIIAARTSCPVTQQALMGVVDDLSEEGVEDDLGLGYPEGLMGLV
jgi:hypothetical protein